MLGPSRPLRLQRVGSLLVLFLILMGCKPQEPAGYGSSGYSYPAYDMVAEFKNDAPSNAQPLENFKELVFQTVGGETVDLQKYLGQKNVVLVITRGLSGTLPTENSPAGAGQICTYCATQTSRLAANYPEFEKRNAEVVIVFPVVKSEQAGRIADFEKQAQIAGKKTDALPFPLLLDVELKSVDALGIRKDLSKPATYILDQEGNLRYAYVGESLVDRPSAQALLKQLDEINQSGA